MEEYNIVICGVGGQGNILASKIIAHSALRLGFNARVGETHGMSQRGGSVISHVRFGDNVHGALTPEAHGDLMLAFEPIESLRYINYLKKDAYIILNTRPLIPISVNAGLAKYPDLDTIIEKLESVTKNIIKVDASKIALEAGSIITLNIVMVGLSTRIPNFPIPKDQIIKSIEELVKPKFINLNLDALNKGANAYNM